MFFIAPKKQPEFDLKVKLNGKRLGETDSLKFLGTKTDKILTWKQQVSHVALELGNSNAVLSKLRHVLDICFSCLGAKH